MVSPEERCAWIKVSGTRCKQKRLGAEYCDFHATMLAERARRLTLAQDTIDIPVDQHLKMELRAAYVMTRILELEIHDLGLGHEAWIFEEVETESRTSDNTSLAFEATRRKKIIQQHPVLGQYIAERRHHLDVIKLCVAAGLAARQIAAVERVVDSIMTAQMMLAEALGFDPTTPDVRGKIMDTLRRAQQQMEQADPRAIEG